MQARELVNYLEQLLQPQLCQDYCPNGLQVAGTSEIANIVTAVSAGYSVIEQAVSLEADALLVHHGYFWKGEAPVITGSKKQRLQALLNHDINLIAYHLPLDVHHEFGNNTQLAKQLNFTIKERIAVAGNADLLILGSCDQSYAPDQFASYLQSKLSQDIQHLPGSKSKIEAIAWCTGAAQDFIEIAAEYGVDAYISGEVSERSFYLAAETGVHYYACGHHATERYGIQALGAHLQEQFGLQHQYIEVNNPI